MSEFDSLGNLVKKVFASAIFGSFSRNGTLEVFKLITMKINILVALNIRKEQTAILDHKI